MNKDFYSTAIWLLGLILALAGLALLLDWFSVSSAEYVQQEERIREYLHWNVAPGVAFLISGCFLLAQFARGVKGRQ
jgi:hypothetical protein